MKNSLLVSLVILGIGIIGGMVIIMQSDPTSQPIPVSEADTTVIASVSAQEFTEGLSQRTLVDIRTPEEYAAGHIPGASNIDFYDADFAEQFAAYNRSEPLAIYCRSGGRSGQAFGILEGMGFTNIVDLAGGIMSWERNGGGLE
jgi:rhodanese-related sulfurtransferase